MSKHSKIIPLRLCFRGQCTVFAVCFDVVKMPVRQKNLFPADLDHFFKFRDISVAIPAHILDRKSVV